MAAGEENGCHLSLEDSRVWGKRERAMVVLCCALINDLASAHMLPEAGTISKDVQLTKLPESGGS